MAEQRDLSPTQRALLKTLFVVFVAVWVFVGVRGLILDDSRWAWGMFPYVLAVEVKKIEFVDQHGRRREWKNSGKVRVPRSLRPGNKNEFYGYGHGAYVDLIEDVLDVVAKDKRKRDVAVEATIETKRSEREPVTEVVRREL